MNAPSVADMHAQYLKHGSVHKAAAVLGMTGGTLHRRLKGAGLITPMRKFSASDMTSLTKEYEHHANAGTLDVLAKKMGRTRQFICRKAREAGLTDPARSRPYADATHLVACSKSDTPPSRFKGRRHSAEAKEKLQLASKRSWDKLSAKEYQARVDKVVSGGRSYREENPKTYSRGSWKSGWRDIGDCRKYYRSRWEANYARYLQWLLERGQIKSWAHEPETFWFEAIRRGVRSYLPDFRVVEIDGRSRLHEVKGWMDGRSRTTLRRMAKYYPEEEIVLIEKAQYRAIEIKASALIDGWET